MEEIYVSVDIETDGPCPGINSMLSIGAVAIDTSRPPGEEIVDLWATNLTPLEEATADAATMAWWAKHPEAWVWAREQPRRPHFAMPEFAAWLNGLGKPPIFVAHPVGFDWPFVYYYFHRFVGSNPFVRNALDIETYAMARLGCKYLEAGDSSWPEHWRAPTSNRMKHVALVDAYEQAEAWIRILHDSRRAQ